MTQKAASTPAWLPYVGVAVMVGGLLVQYGVNQANRARLEATVRRLEEEQRVTNVINYSAHPEWTASILAAEGK